MPYMAHGSASTPHSDLDLVLNQKGAGNGWGGRTTLTVFKNDGDGSFTKAGDYQLGFAIQENQRTGGATIALGDIDSDVSSICVRDLKCVTRALPPLETIPRTT